MFSKSLRIVALALFAASLAGCASAPSRFGSNGPISCVPYARAKSGVNIHGDAGTWWDRAAGHYDRRSTPQKGSVLVFAATGRLSKGHVAVVRRIVSAKEIRVDHSNWSGDGNVALDDPVLDASGGRDWTAVRIWNRHSNSWGTHVYPVLGFVGPGGSAERVASVDIPEEFERSFK